ncbi:hypothetical protein TR67_01675 [Pseudomonas deceptionensis]|nr:hypothetical protein TR67_01675 [Pseudomonas deceptionensis]
MSTSGETWGAALYRAQLRQATQPTYLMDDDNATVYSHLIIQQKARASFEMRAWVLPGAN